MATDVIVIGGGVIGCAAAAELARSGLEVLLLERDAIASAASGRNQGLLLPRREGRYQSLFHEGVDGFRRLAGEGRVPFGLRPVGHLLLAGDEDGLALARVHADAIAAGGLPVEALEPAAVARLEPGLAPDLAGAFRCEGAHALDPGAATLALAEAARRAGATVRTHEGVRALLHSGDRVTGVVSDSGPVAAAAVVVAAGPWSRRLAASTGADLMVSGARGWLLQTAPLPWRAGHVLEEATWPTQAGIGALAGPPTVAALADGGAPAGDGSNAFTMQQAPGGNAVVGASLAASIRDDPERPETVRGLARRALRFLPRLAEVPVIATWSGVRPVTPDGLPLVGPVPGVEGLWAATGHGPDGVLLAPSTARMLAAHLAGGAPAAEAAAFDPARFAGGDGQAATVGGSRHAGRDGGA